MVAWFVWATSAPAPAPPAYWGCDPFGGERGSCVNYHGNFKDSTCDGTCGANASTPVYKCKTDWDCSLSGTCDTASGKCTCDAWASGSDCSYLRFKAIDKAAIGYVDKQVGTSGAKPNLPTLTRLPSVVACSTRRGGATRCWAQTRSGTCSWPRSPARPAPRTPAAAWAAGAATRRWRTPSATRPRAHTSASGWRQRRSITTPPSRCSPSAALAETESRECPESLLNASPRRRSAPTTR
jgi:hypothetical protein